MIDNSNFDIPNLLNRADEYQKSVQYDAERHFNYAAIYEAKYKGGPRQVYVFMKPAEFLSMAEPLEDDTGIGTGRNGIKLSNIEQFETLPQLSLTRGNRHRSVKVTYHDGRHRARELMRRGEQLMPVVLKFDNTLMKKPKSGGMVFVDDFIDYMEAEDGRSTMPFPFEV